MRLKCLLLACLLIVLAVIVHALNFDHNVSAEKGVQAIKKIPLNFGKWRGFDQPLDKLVYDILETRAIIHRTYRNNEGDAVFLSIVYYDETKVDFHAPEACLGGQGVKTDKSSSGFTIETGQGEKVFLKVNQLIQHQDNNKTLVYYFYKTGDFIGRNYIQLRLNLVMNMFRNSKKNGSLIRISAPLTNAESEHTTVLLKDFLTDLFPYIIEYL